MAQATFVLGRGMLRVLSRILGFILSLFGMISSSCGFAPDYGVPSILSISGSVSSDNVSIQGIRVRTTGTDSSLVYASELTSEDGLYYMYPDLDFPWPDTIRVAVTDIDGELNGSFLPEDTLLISIPYEEHVDLNVDFRLIPVAEEEGNGIPDHTRSD
jgi:hypothetical protein